MVFLPESFELALKRIFLVKTSLTSRALLCLIGLFLAAPVAAQFPAKIKDGLKTYLSPDSTTWLKLNFVAQAWARYNESNPGSTVYGQPQNNTYDVGIRRVRFVLSGQLSDRVFMFVQFGQNNLSYLSTRKTGAFFHDVTGEYAIIRKKVSLGFGLHGWNGPSRFSNSSVSTILMLDPPIFQETSNDVNDQFVRKLGIYAKGKLGKLDYRLSASKPFVVQTQTAAKTPDPLSANSTFSLQVPQQALQGYFMYQFLDQESNAGPGTVGTYLGKKRVFNIGAGFVHQGKAMWTKTAVNDTLYHAMNLWAVDIFYDAPIDPSKGTALTLYGGYFNYDYGKGYIRNVAPMNPTDGTNSNGSFNGSGNGAPIIGNGYSLYLQSGYKFRDNLLGDQGTLQVYAATQYGKFDRLNDPMVLVDAGINWLVSGHNSKFTLNYQSRPIYSNTDVKVHTRRGEWVLQYQVSF